jgi:hypothetical protein
VCFRQIRGNTFPDTAISIEITNEKENHEHLLIQSWWQQRKNISSGAGHLCFDCTGYLSGLVNITR